MLLLVNEATSGSGELFTAMLQDAGRAIVFGGVTAGVGTAGSSYFTGAYAQGYANLSVALAVRPGTVTAAGFPATSYIENVGIRPDVPYDIFTVEDLAVLGARYVAAFTQRLLEALP